MTHSTFIVLGGDGNHYGPVTVEQFQAWAREGRVNGQTRVSRGEGIWAAAASVGELAGFSSGAASLSTSGSFGIPASPQADVERPQIDPDTLNTIKSGANWFYWIAGLSLVNSLLSILGADWRFFFGLGITELFDFLAENGSNVAKLIALSLSATAAGLLIVLGVLARKQHSWAFIVGMVLFGLDGLLCGLAQDWISVAVHAFALFGIFKGFQANRAAKA